jgi:UDP-N-acetylglucosamine:LPS N-acetylglucosamine transferase
VEKAVDLLDDFLKNPEKFRKLSENMAAMGKPEAANTMIEKISEFLD